MKKPINIAIVEDSKLTIDGWKVTFSEIPDINIIGTAQNKDAFWKIAIEHEDVLEVLVMDKNIDGKTQIDDFSFINETRKRFPNQKIIVYTWDYHTQHVNYLKQMKINGYLPSSLASELMYDAIISVMNNLPFFPQDERISLEDKSGYDKGKEFDIEFLKLVNSLSPGQNKVAALLAKDMLNPHIAKQLDISIKAVENQVSKIYHKLHICPDEEQARSKFNRFFGEYFRRR